MNLYQLYDRAAGAVMGPIMSERMHQTAIRTFRTILKDERTLPGQHPGDFDLYCLGRQDENTARIQALESPQLIATGEDENLQLHAQDAAAQQLQLETGMESGSNG